jgi:tetratricopeptide (TPR) repeat protein
VTPLHRLAVISLLAGLCCVRAVASNDAQAEQLNREFQAAATLYDSGRYAEAASQLEVLARQAPQTFEVHELLGLAYAAQQQDSKAIEHLQEAVRLKPHSALARTNLATNLMRAKKVTSAEEQFRKAVELDPRNFDTNHNLGEFYLQIGKIKDGARFLEQAQRIDPKSYDNGYDLALADAQIGELASARSVILALLQFKNTAELHNLLGQVEEKAGNFIQAANEFETAAHLDPSENNLFDWGSELLLHRTLDPAVEVFEHATERYATSPRLAIGLGMALYSRGNYDAAVKALLKAADLNPSDSRCYFFLSKAYDSSPNQADDVIKRFRRFAELQPNNARALYYYAMSLWKGRRMQDGELDVQQIESLLRRSIAADPAFAESHLQLANLLSDQKKFADAIPEYLRAVERDADLSDAHYRLGHAYVRTGQKDKAQEQFAIYQQLRAQHLAELDKQRAEIRQFVYSAQSTTSKRPTDQQ